MSILGTLAVIAGVIYVGVSLQAQKEEEEKDRKANPEKWAKIDSDLWDKQAEEYWLIYSKAMEKVPRSEWLLMDREEKSEYFKQREDLKPEFEKLAKEVKERVRKNYSVDVSFPDSN